MNEQDLYQAYRQVRQQSQRLAAPLSEADLTIQASDFASPGKWHLAHTTWFFEEFVLRNQSAYRSPSDDYRFLFNSYYNSVGERQPRARRGLITRPDLAQVMSYRQAVDDGMLQLIERGPDAATRAVIELGLHHEQQHQELFLTDILHTLAQNPLHPAYQAWQAVPLASHARNDARNDHPRNDRTSNDSSRRSPTRANSQRDGHAADGRAIDPAREVRHAGGLRQLGHSGDGFCYDNETPSHPVHLPDYRLAMHLVTNADWIDFIRDGGYRNPLLWLSDGWSTVQAEGWRFPEYWIERDGDHASMTLAGLQPVDPQAPVTHISYFEADAFARWAGRRLPTEAEWENAARDRPLSGHFADSGLYRPLPAPGPAVDGHPLQLFGDVWEWTASPYVAYPGFRTSAGAIGEYNGKFMNGQYVLRGGSCVTPPDHIRLTYRNFFYPHQRWQFTGLRLAGDA